MPWFVADRAVKLQAASTRQMGRFETEILATEDHLAVLADLSGNSAVEWEIRLPLEVLRWYDGRRFGGYVGKIGLIRIPLIGRLP